MRISLVIITGIALILLTLVIYMALSVNWRRRGVAYYIIMAIIYGMFFLLTIPMLILLIKMEVRHYYIVIVPIVFSVCKVVKNIFYAAEIIGYEEAERFIISIDDLPIDEEEKEEDNKK